MLELNKLYNMDCMDGMREFPDGYFDLAIVDPPYGIGEDWKKRSNRKNKFISTSYRNNAIPNSAYFSELKRVSKNRIIWGYNYFVEHLGATNSLIFWDKLTENVFYSGGEIAYTSFRRALSVCRFMWDGARMGAETSIKKIHPHQKPLKLYGWILRNYAKAGDKILDTHAGSASSLVACHNAGYDYVGFELDEHYYKLAQERLDAAKAQLDLFKDSDNAK